MNAHAQIPPWSENRSSGLWPVLRDCQKRLFGIIITMTLHGNPRQAPSAHSHTVVELAWLLKSGHAQNVLNNTSLWVR